MISMAHTILMRRRCPRPSIIPPAISIRIPVPYPRSVPRDSRPLLILPSHEEISIGSSRVGKIIAVMLSKLSELGLDSAILRIVELCLLLYVAYTAYHYTPPTPELDQFVNAFFNNSYALARLVGRLGGGPEDSLVFMKQLLVAVFDGNKKMKSVLLSALGRLEVFSAEDIVNAFVSLMGDETYLFKEPAFFLSGLVVEDVLAAATLDDFLKKLPLNPSVAETVEVAKSLISLHASRRVLGLAHQRTKSF